MTNLLDDNAISASGLNVFHGESKALSMQADELIEQVKLSIVQQECVEANLSKCHVTAVRPRNQVASKITPSLLSKATQLQIQSTPVNEY